MDESNGYKYTQSQKLSSKRKTKRKKSKTRLNKPELLRSAVVRANITKQMYCFILFIGYEKQETVRESGRNKQKKFQLKSVYTLFFQITSSRKRRLND